MKTVGFLLIAISLAIFIPLVVIYINFKQDCSGYLERASNANTVELASTELNKSIQYLEKEGDTTGYTSVLWRTPDEDIGFFYHNLKQAQAELSKVDSNTSALEKSNILMKLRETLMERGDKGDNITYPDGLAYYPHNAVSGTLLWVSILSFIMGLGILGVKFDD